MQQAAYTAGLTGCHDLLRQLDVRFGEILAVGQLDVAAVQHPDQIDHRILTAHQLLQGLRAVNVGFRHRDTGLHDQRLGPLAPARRHGDLDTALGQTIDDIGADKTAPAQQQNFFDAHQKPRKT